MEPADVACGKAVSGSTLLDLGHAGLAARSVWLHGDRLLTSDANGHWVLWDMSTRQQVATGDAVSNNGAPAGRAELVGGTFVVFQPWPWANVEVRDPSDGHLLRTFSAASGPYTTVPHLSYEGNYVWNLSSNELRAWSLAGELLVQWPGDFGEAVVFAAAEELRVLRGPINAQVIEHVSLSSEPTTTVTFTGEFHGWFSDGSHFFTGRDPDLRIYSAAGELRQLPTSGGGLPNFIGGYGNFYWTTEWGNGWELVVREVGSGNELLRLQNALVNPPSSRGVLAAAIATNTLKLVKLDGARPIVAEWQVPGEGLVAFAADALDQWAISTNESLIFAGGPTTPVASSFGCGVPVSIAGSRTGRAAVATSDGQLRIYDLTNGSPSRIAQASVRASALSMASDGTTLLVESSAYSTNGYDGSLRAYDLPSFTLRHEWTFVGAAGPHFNYAAASDVERIAFYTCLRSTSDAPYDCTIRVTNYDDTDILIPPIAVTLPLGLGPDFIQLSPGGTRLSIFVRDLNSSPSTFLYDAGLLRAKLSGDVAGWLDDEHLLLNHYQTFRDNYMSYLDTVLTDLTGAPVGATVGWRNTGSQGAALRAVDDANVYAVKWNQIYSVSDGQIRWTGPFRISQPLGAVAGSYVVYPSTHLVVFDPWR